MKFAAAAITPGRANTCQNGTEPSAKSTQSVPLPEIPHVPASARCGSGRESRAGGERDEERASSRPGAQK